MPVHLRAEGAFDYVVLVPEEPAWTWHAPTERGRALAALRAGSAGLGWGLRRGAAPAAPRVAGGLAGTAAHGGRRLTAAVAAGLGLLVCAWWTLAGPTRIAVPRGDAARALHEELLRRVYAGFDATTEQGVFRALQGSVTAELLEPLYQGIRESLVMADEGGPSVGSSEWRSSTPSSSARASAAGASFVVDSEWRVDGRVIHFGHEHARRTRYRGEVTISARPEEEGLPSWRICGLQVREQVREPSPRLPRPLLGDRPPRSRAEQPRGATRSRLSSSRQPSLFSRPPKSITLSSTDGSSSRASFLIRSPSDGSASSVISPSCHQQASSGSSSTARLSRSRAFPPSPSARIMLA